MSNQGAWLELYTPLLSEAQVRDLKRELTFTIKPFMKLKPKEGEEPEPDKVIKGYEETDDTLRIPRMAPADVKIFRILRWPDLDNLKFVDQDRNIPEERLFIDEDALSGFKTRKHQKYMVDAMMDSCGVRDSLGGILQSPCGTGKTVMSAEMIVKKGKRAIVLVHKEFLFKQWVKAFEVATPKLIVAEVGGKRKLTDAWKEADVCIVMIQTLLSKKFMKKIDPEFYQRWGLTCFDEIHMYGGERWNEVIPLFDAGTRIGVSATPKRPDGCMDLIKYHVGQIEVVGKSALLVPKVKRVQYKGKFKIQPWMRDERGTLKQPILENMLVERKDRNEVIIQQCAGAVNAGRSVLVLTARREHAKMLKAGVEALIPGVKAGLYMAGLKKGEFSFSEEAAQIVFGTWHMSSQGLDIPRLDTLVMATPRSNVEQGVGRILRDDLNKKNPIVVDIIDVGISDCINKFNGPRRSVYRKLRVEVEKVAYNT